MKELSIEEKARRYDETLERAKKWHNAPNIDKMPTYGNRIIEEIFPELKENDEMIRKEILEYFQQFKNEGLRGINISDWIAWLEKQAEHANFRNKIQIGDKVTRNEAGILVNISQLNRIAKPRVTNNVKPKFKVGNWIVYCNKDVDLITGIEENGYRINNGGYIPFVCESDIRLWSIQDAKSGDVLVCKKDTKYYERICLFNSLESAFFILTRDYNYVETYDIVVHVDYPNNTVPATKKQKEILCMAMKHAGYTFDFEKKELKKMELNPDDLIEESYQQQADDLINIVTEKSAWSEEDKDFMYDTLSNLTELKDRYGEGYGNVGKCIDWLKSLKQRIGWKPSEEQMKALEHFIRSIGESGFASPYDNNTKLLYSLLEQLRKLKG